MTGVKKPKIRRGFTLVEALVTLAIFGVLMISITDIYIQNMRFARQIIMRAKLQGDARYALEALTRAIRVSDIDYVSWGGTLPGQPQTELRLVNLRTGDTSRIRLESTDGGCYGDGKSYPCITVSTDGGSPTPTWAPLTPKNVKIDNLRFYTTPSKDPFNFNTTTGAYDSDGLATDQPIVTISVQFHGIAPRASDEWIYSLQTTVTPRLYLR
jgi:prepilin-type N-terminal cleavage/methylation domain-containing protein